MPYCLKINLHGERGKHHLVHLVPGDLVRVRVARHSSLGLQSVTIDILYFNGKPRIRSLTLCDVLELEAECNSLEREPLFLLVL